MKKILLILFVLFALGEGAAFAKDCADFNVVPLPQSVVKGSSSSFFINKNTKIYYGQSEKRNAQFLQEYVRDITGMKLEVTEKRQKKNVISLSAIKKANVTPEGYSISVKSSEIEIQGNSEAGIFYGIQTLRKSLPVVKCSEVEVPSVVIEDFPHFSYRGAHLDVVRHFFPIDSVKKYIDIISLHNANVLHLHLTDDQGWRLEIKSHPLLTKIGSMRAQTNGDGVPYGGFYTQDEIRDLIKYAAERYITVIPEIDIPAHCAAALASYPELGCTGGPYKVWEAWGGPLDVLCAGNPNTFDFLKDVYSEVAALFPSKYIHIGGDECPKQRWKECSKCQAKIAELGIKSDSIHSAEQQLQSYMMTEVEKFLATKGKKVIGWDEILEGGLGPDAVVQSWRGMDGAREAVEQGHDAIISPTSHCYFDYDQEKRTSLEKVYSLIPVPNEFNAEQAKHILGVQANVWTEYMDNFPHVQYMLLPRFAALSEIQWSAPESRNYANFLKRLNRLEKVYDNKGYKYAPITNGL